MIHKNVSLEMFSLFNYAPNATPVLDRIAALLNQDDLTIEVAQIYDLEEAEEAQRAVIEDSFVGKIVLIP